MSIEDLIGKRSLEPAVYYCGIDKDLPPGIRYGPVKRDVYIVECNTDGYGSAVINGTEHKVTPRSCYFLMPGDTVLHTADTVSPRQGYWCAIDGLPVGRVLHKVGITSESPFAPSGLFDDICAVLKEILDLSDERDPGVDLRRAACVYKLLGILLRDTSHTDTDSRIQNAIGFMEANYPLSISVEALAERAGFERSYFSTLFKAKTGVSPHSYLTALRIKKAISLMSEGAFSVPIVAEAVGLDPLNFSRVFKRVTGMPPLAYIKASGKK